MKVSIHQPNLFPRLKVMQKIASTEVWVILDDVQYVTREWQNRARIRSLDHPLREFWVTFPVRRPKGSSSLIKETEIIDLATLRRKSFASLFHCYGKSPSWSWIERYFHAFAEASDHHLSRTCVASALSCFAALEIPVHVVYSSSIGVTGKRSELLVNLCEKLDARVYVSGSGGRGYLDRRPFEQRNIHIKWQNWIPPDDFLTWRDVSFLDYLARRGPEKLREHLTTGA